VAHGANGRGDVVGQSAPAQVGTPLHAFLYRDGITYDLGVPCGGFKSWAVKVNARGDVVGYSVLTQTSGEFRAFIYDSRRGVTTCLDPNAHASDINAAGEITGGGLFSGNSFSHAFLYASGRIIDLGTLEGDLLSQGAALNDLGEVVGMSHTPGVLGSRAFLFTNGSMVDLNTVINADSGWASLEGATGINNVGQIVGNGRTLAGEQHAFLLTPQ
jgi:probable HAF family extracellular repeat protein